MWCKSENKPKQNAIQGVILFKLLTIKNGGISMRRGSYYVTINLTIRHIVTTNHLHIKMNLRLISSVF